MGAQNFNFAPKLPQWGIFSPKFRGGASLAATTPLVDTGHIVQCSKRSIHVHLHALLTDGIR